MKTPLVCFVALCMLLPASVCLAGLDLDQEVIHIPDTHESEKYRWQVARNPAGYGFELASEAAGPSGGRLFTMTLGVPPGVRVEKAHVFITDRDLKTMEHFRAERSGDGSYRFRFNPPVSGAYHVETVLQARDGWVNLSKTVNLPAGPVEAADGAKQSAMEYRVRQQHFPPKIYAEHVVTFLYEITLNGRPVTDIEKIDGLDMQVAAWATSWFTPVGEFAYGVPAQNPGGPEVAVSMVFEKPGTYKVFAEYVHRGVRRLVETEVEVWEEIDQKADKNKFLQPAD